MRMIAVLGVGIAIAGSVMASDKVVTTQEARIWVVGIRAAEQRGDVKAVLQMARDETVFYLDLAEYPGAGLTLKASSLREWIEQNVSRKKGKPKAGVRCGYEPVPEDGTVIERCVGPAAGMVASNSNASAEFIYTVNVIKKDGRGLFSKTTWVSDKKLF